jgi:hypothetical protein
LNLSSRSADHAFGADVPAAGGETRQVLYKGPFARATADGGHVFERGKRTAVPAAVWNQLRHGPTAEQFLFFESGQPTGCPTR